MSLRLSAGPGWVRGEWCEKPARPSPIAPRRWRRLPRCGRPQPLNQGAAQGCARRAEGLRDEAVAVAAVQPLGALLVVVSAAAPFNIDLHQALDHELHHLAQLVDAGSLLGEFSQCHSGGGHHGLHSIKVDGSLLNLIRTHDRHALRYGCHSFVASHYAVVCLTPLSGTSPELV